MSPTAGRTAATAATAEMLFLWPIPTCALCLIFGISGITELRTVRTGQGDMCKGKRGEDVIIKVPCGTVIKDGLSGRIMADMYKPGERKIILKGRPGRQGQCPLYYSHKTGAKLFSDR